MTTFLAQTKPDNKKFIAGQELGYINSDGTFNVPTVPNTISVTANRLGHTLGGLTHWGGSLVLSVSDAITNDKDILVSQILCSLRFQAVNGTSAGWIDVQLGFIDFMVDNEIIFRYNISHSLGATVTDSIEFYQGQPIFEPFLLKKGAQIKILGHIDSYNEGAPFAWEYNYSASFSISGISIGN